jgi:hypothetical protein
MTLRVCIIGLALIGTCALGACGRQASLDRPGPLTGRAAGSHPGPERTERDQAAARARKDAVANADPTPPQSIDEVRNIGLSHPPDAAPTSPRVNPSPAPSQPSGDR